MNNYNEGQMLSHELRASCGLKYNGLELMPVSPSHELRASCGLKSEILAVCRGAEGHELRASCGLKSYSSLSCTLSSAVTSFALRVD